MADQGPPRRIDPFTGRPFDLLAYIPLVILLATAVSIWAGINSRLGALEHEQVTIRDVIADRIGIAAARESDQEGRLRALEFGSAQVRERLDYLVEGVKRIEDRLEAGIP